MGVGFIGKSVYIIKEWRRELSCWREGSPGGRGALRRGDRMRIALVMTLSLVASTALAAGEPCELGSVKACQNTNQLVWSKTFKPALDRFLGKRKVGWLGPKKDIGWAVDEVLGGPPDDVVKVGEHMLRFSAVRFQSAEERGSVFISDTGDIMAVGALHFDCAKGCDKAYTLTMVLPGKDKALEKQVRAWGDEQMKLNADGQYQPAITKIAKVEVMESAR